MSLILPNEPIDYDRFMRLIMGDLVIPGQPQSVPEKLVLPGEGDASRKVLIVPGKRRERARVKFSVIEEGKERAHTACFSGPGEAVITRLDSQGYPTGETTRIQHQGFVLRLA